MPDIELLNVTPDMARDLDEPARFERRHGVVVGEQARLVRDVVAQTEALRARTGAELRWSGYLAVEAASRAVVGICGFTGPPDAAGAVEIAYFTFPPFERRGHAGAMARALLAVAEGSVRLVIAHTLPESNASTRILERLGFTRTGTVQDPDAGAAWRWERPAPSHPRLQADNLGA